MKIQVDNKTTSQPSEEFRNVRHPRGTASDHLGDRKPPRTAIERLAERTAASAAELPRRVAACTGALDYSRQFRRLLLHFRSHRRIKAGCSRRVRRNRGPSASCAGRNAGCCCCCCDYTCGRTCFLISNIFVAGYCNWRWEMPTFELRGHAECCSQNSRGFTGYSLAGTKHCNGQ